MTTHDAKPLSAEELEQLCPGIEAAVANGGRLDFSEQNEDTGSTFGDDLLTLIAAARSAQPPAVTGEAEAGLVEALGPEDGGKMLLLADWLDLKFPNGGDEVQQDLRRWAEVIAQQIAYRARQTGASS